MRLLSLPLITVLVSALAIPYANADDKPMDKPKTTQQDTKPTKTKDTKAAMADADLKALAEIHHVNQMEIGAAKLALKQGTAKIKDYANSLVTDHTSNDKDLMALAKKKTVTVPAHVPQTDVETAKLKEMTDTMAKLAKLKGADFDTAYLAMQATAHDDVVAKLAVHITAASDADVKTFLTMTKPVIELHAKRAKDLLAAAATQLPKT